MTSNVNWPSDISVLYESLEEGINRATLRAPFEAGYEQTRAKWTRGRRFFTLGWANMKEVSFNSLLTFFGTTVQGGVTSFNWYHPSGSSYECRFMEDELMMTSNVSGYYSGRVRLRQV